MTNILRLSPDDLMASFYATFLLSSLRATMNKADSDRIQELCSLIAVEKDRRKFLTLVEELNQILATRDDQLRDARSGNSKKE